MPSSIPGPLWVLFNSHNNFAKEDPSLLSLLPPILQKRKLRLRKRALLQTWDHESKVTAFSVPEADWAFLRSLSLFLRKFPIHKKKDQVQKWYPCWRCLGKGGTRRIEQQNISQAPYKIITYLRILFPAVTNSILLLSPLKENFSPSVS